MGSALDLPRDEIHLWSADYAQIDDAALLSEYRSLLSESEQSQEGRFYFARDRRRYLVTRAMVRTLLSKYADTRPECWKFRDNDYGRPEVDAGCAAPAPLCFNVSHTHSLVLFAIAWKRTVGVDVENIQSRPAALDIADHYFSAREVAALRGLPVGEQHYRFFEYWTFKEAYIKARGMGLSLPLDKFSFEFPTHAGVRLRIDAELEDDASRWRLWQYRPSHEYLVAVCAERLNTAQVRVVFRNVVPLLTERLIELEPLRRSETR